MAEVERGSSTGIVAILAIFVILAIVALFVFGGRLFNRGPNIPSKIDVNVQAPGSK
jgi:hypothetical protein